MLLDLSRIRTPRNRYERVFEPAAFSPDDAFRVVEPVALDFDILKDKQTFRLTGSVRTTLELPCSRCLEPFRWPVDASFDLRYQPHAEPGSGPHDEIEIEEDDLSTAFYDNDEIDLEQLMREQFLLAIPMKPLCSEACHGLCSVCGTNLNRTTCACRRDWDDPRMAALREIGTKRN
jgi:uncharacterized protein